MKLKINMVVLLVKKSQYGMMLVAHGILLKELLLQKILKNVVRVLIKIKQHPDH
jgi:hypothetical protein